MKVVTELPIRGLSDLEVCVLWLDLLFPQGNTVPFFSRMIRMLLGSRTFSSRQTDAVCAHLVERGMMKRVYAASSVDRREYKGCARYESGALAALRERAVAHAWFPTLEVVKEAFSYAGDYCTHERGVQYAFPESGYQRVLAMRTLLGCWAHGAADDAFVSSDGAFDGACFLTGRLADNARLLTGELRGATDVRLLPAAMSAFFCAGRDVGSMLETVRVAAEKKHERFPAVVVLTYGALRVWRGESAQLDGLEDWLIPEDALRLMGVENAFKCAAAGEWQTAAATLSSVVSSRFLAGGNAILFPFLSLVFAIGLQVDMPAAKFRKIASLMEKSLPVSVEVRWHSDPLREKVMGWVRERVNPFGSVAHMGALSGAILESPGGGVPPAFGAIPLAFSLHALGYVPEEKVIEQTRARNLAQQAVRVLSAGYSVLGGILLAGATRCGDSEDADYQCARDMFDKSRVPWLLPPYRREEAWKRMVTELSKVVGMDGGAGLAKEVKEKRGTVVWGLQFDTVVYNEVGASDVCGPVVCTDIAPYYRGPRAPNDGSGDRRMTPNGILGKAYQNLLTEQDRRVLDEIARTRYNGLRDRKVPISVIEALIDHPFVTEVFPNYFYESRSHAPRPLMLTRMAWHVSSVQTEEGGLCLSLPFDMHRGVDGPCLIRLDLNDVCFLSLNERERTFVAGFFGLAPDGEMRLPKQALEAVSPVLTAMARIAPMEGNFSALADTSGLERVPGETVPTARLAFADDVLELSLCVKPHAKNAALVFKPGVGAPERMIKDGKVTQVLVRNLAAEKAAAKRVTDALADFAGWSDGEDTWRFEDLGECLSVLAVLKDLGEGVRMEWREGSRLEVATKVTTRGGLTSKGGADRWFRVDGEFQVDETTTLSLLELLKAFRGRVGHFVPLSERGYLRISAALARRLEALEAAGRERAGELAVAPAALPMLGGVFSKDDGEMALPRAMTVEADRIQAAFASKQAVPDRLKATLRSYQEDGYVWLARLADCGFGACLADDMGLGKTVQLIALLLARAKDGASLVVAPTSVGGNWRQEIERFAPTLRCLCAWETDDDVWQKAAAHEVVITSYGMLVSREEKFLSREWNGVVLDEAQAVKNEGTERARIVKRLAARFRVAATGTPIENRLTELWSIFDFINPGLLGTSNEFVARLTDEGRATPALKNLVKPLILRRLKRDVLDDLPEKTEITLSVQLDADERAGYEACRRKALETLAEGGQSNRISILAELTRLRRYCCHPSLVMPGMAESAKMEALVELLRDLRGANHRVLVFSQFTDYLALVGARLKAEGVAYQYLDGATPPQERERRVAAFQQGEGDVFLMSLKAGGTGINLTAANYVVLLDPWWNPAVEDQAADRVHRIGQKHPVTVYRLIAADTVEERVLELHAEKKLLASDVLGGTGSSALTPEALMKLFG